ncbi:hypothetical protein LSH36_438g00009 [Paralvinella palmiformis]|uniref:CRAL-TRIO domain-containing protein n=1 Tax=Paralvinella palmiformis TaxID=53620 RepID=A0AAD9MZS2_9ANNE|nr:hypothetical protein LSH36_438g00009 [Paralvinella palmiformis]
MASECTPYECKLDQETQKKAQDELFEDPQNRQGAIDAFRTWIKQQKHINCPTDDVFLLGFLRAKHFSQLEAREGLERFMAIRDKLSGWMKNLDPASDEMTRIIDIGILLMMPDREDHNVKLYIYRPALLDGSKKELITSCLRLFVTMCYLTFFCDEMSQIHGVSYTYDSFGYTMTKYLKIPLEIRQNLGSMVSKAFPARVKAIHMCNTEGLLEMLLSVFKKIVTEKINKRIKVHSHGLESWYKDIPMRVLPTEYLPDDYQGPNAGNVDTIKASMKKTFQEPEIRERIKYLSSDEFYINMKDKDFDIPTASFRQLNVD